MLNKGSLIDLKFDVVVVGGGLAGICAAVASARLGAKTALIQDRSVLGGNSSSEIRVWACGAVAGGRNRYAAETGLIGELDLENLYRNPQGNPYLWDSILMDFVLREPMLCLYLNTYATKVELKNDKIQSVDAVQTSTEKTFHYTANFFVDCTGDGKIAYLSKVPYFQGMENKGRYQESLAPEKDELFTLGSTLLLYTRDAGHPIQFHAPDFAYPINYMDEIINGNHKPLSLQTNGCDLWWLEYGGEKDTIRDGESIRMELQKLQYGLWNYIKNSGRFDADNLELEWVGTLPGKRESRRFLGEYVLNQNDILHHSTFCDAVSYGGWPVDTHPSKGIYAKEEPCNQIDAGIYQIPLRCLITARPSNLFLAGRDVSVSHLALASTRVMKTCAAMGQACGTAAALCMKWDTVPAALTAEQIHELQQELSWNDQFIPNIYSESYSIPVYVRSSGSKLFTNVKIDQMIELKQTLWIMFPALERLNTLKLYMMSHTSSILKIDVLCGTAYHACDDMELLGSVSIKLPSRPEWVDIPFDFTVCTSMTKGKNLYFVLSSADARIGVSRYPVTGCVGSMGSRTGFPLCYPCFQIDPCPPYYRSEEVLSWKSRPDITPNEWVSTSLSEGPVFLELQPKYPFETDAEMMVIFDSDLNRDYNHLRPNIYDDSWNSMPPQLVRSFQVKIKTNDPYWTEIFSCQDNYRRCRKIFLPKGTSCIRFDFFSTWGSPYIHVFSVRFRPKQSF